MDKGKLLDDVMDLLKDLGVLRGNHIIEKIKPGHGNCCTCQDCGYHHDDCVCCHNETLEKLLAIFKQDT